MFYKIVFLIVVVFPFLGTLVAIWLLWQRAVHWSDLALFVGMYVIAGFGETVGFHRMLTHRSFQARPVVKFLLLVFGTMAIQGPPKLTSEQIRTDYSFKSPMMKQMILRLYRATDPKLFALWENALLKLTVSIPTLVLWETMTPISQNILPSDLDQRQFSNSPTVVTGFLTRPLMRYQNVWKNFSESKTHRCPVWAQPHMK